MLAKMEGRMMTMKAGKEKTEDMNEACLETTEACLQTVVRTSLEIESEAVHEDVPKEAAGDRHLAVRRRRLQKEYPSCWKDTASGTRQGQCCKRSPPKDGRPRKAAEE
jgi:hypothetical protein